MLKATGLICSLAVLAACQSLDAPPLDDYTLTTDNGVRFRTRSGVDGSCDTSIYSDWMGWGAYHSTVEHNGKIKKNYKFNFASPGQDTDRLTVSGAGADMLILSNEFHKACDQWQLASEAEKPVYLAYFREAITLAFEAVTRFEDAGRLGPDALMTEIDAMRKKRTDLFARRPKQLVRRHP